ncbi:MAG: hypothetical protein GX963_13545 [Bacteroidales bacterium]|nr:hypothetical protein [Bacteroidales bacterium]
MKREKFELEYLLDIPSKEILWAVISTASGLESWFADKVTIKDKKATFTWKKSETREAEIIGYRLYSFIRFRWLDNSNKGEYFEIRMVQNELTNEYVLEVSDFANEDEVEDQIDLWDAEIDRLREVAGL